MSGILDYSGDADYDGRELNIWRKVPTASSVTTPCLFNSFIESRASQLPHSWYKLNDDPAGGVILNSGSGAGVGVLALPSEQTASIVCKGKDNLDPAIRFLPGTSEGASFIIPIPGNAYIESFYIEFWARYDILGSGSVIIEFGAYNGAGLQLYLSDTFTSYVRFSVTDDTFSFDEIYFGLATPNVGDVFHIVATCRNYGDGTGGFLELTVNGNYTSSPGFYSDLDPSMVSTELRVYAESAMSLQHFIYSEVFTLTNPQIADTYAAGT